MTPLIFCFLCFFSRRFRFVLFCFSSNRLNNLGVLGASAKHAIWCEYKKPLLVKIQLNRYNYKYCWLFCNECWVVLFIDFFRFQIKCKRIITCSITHKHPPQTRNRLAYKLDEQIKLRNYVSLLRHCWFSSNVTGQKVNEHHRIRCCQRTVV